MGANFTHVDRRKDMKKLTVAFRNLVKTPKMGEMLEFDVTWSYRKAYKMKKITFRKRVPLLLKRISLTVNSVGTRNHSALEVKG